MESELQQVIDIVRRVGELEQLDPDQDFYAAGIDSMRAMDVMLDLETEFGVAVPDSEFIRARTPRALFDLIQQLRAA